MYIYAHVIYHRGPGNKQQTFDSVLLDDGSESRDPDVILKKNGNQILVSYSVCQMASLMTIFWPKFELLYKDGRTNLKTMIKHV